MIILKNFLVNRFSIFACKSLYSTMSSKQKYLTMPLDEKRKLYKCGNSFVTLDKIPAWETYSAQRELKAILTDGDYSFNKEFNTRLSIFTGDITALEIDVIVNAANKQLAGGSGVDGAIHMAAGRDMLQEECRILGGCETGSVKITGGYKLPAKYIFHTVGPIGEKSHLLKSCYKSSLDLMKENGLKSIAFPCISTGTYGYPNENACHVALSTVRNWMETNEYYKSLDRIIFCLFLQVDIDIYHKLMPFYFPTS